MDEGMVQGEYELGQGVRVGFFIYFFPNNGNGFSGLGFKMIVGQLGFKHEV